MVENLNKKEFEKLIDIVFDIKKADKTISFLMDLPNKNVPDNSQWKETRKITSHWYGFINEKNSLNLENVNFYFFENVERNNNELPKEIYKVESPHENFSTDNLREAKPCKTDDVLSETDIVIAPTYFSATAPLKMLAKEHNFRGASMPGFTKEMIPALGLDYEKIAQRVNEIAEKMNRASGFSLVLETGGKKFKSYFDLRFRKAHSSTGLMRERGMVANLPSGEAYIVPYEGEKEGVPSNSEGKLPVQFGDEIVVYQIANNRAVSVLSKNKASLKEEKMIIEEPAYGNISEIGIGILGDFGVKACGSLLLDEKLGLHIAFGRSEHFGGTVGPKSFKDPKNVVHIDRVYVDSLQPRIKIIEASFNYEDGKRENAL